MSLIEAELYEAGVFGLSAALIKYQGMPLVPEICPSRCPECPRCPSQPQCPECPEGGAKKESDDDDDEVELRWEALFIICTSCFGSGSLVTKLLGSKLFRRFCTRLIKSRKEVLINCVSKLGTGNEYFILSGPMTSTGRRRSTASVKSPSGGC